MHCVIIKLPFPSSEQYFNNINLEVAVFYFTNSCEDLYNSGQVDTVKEEFLAFLTTEGICQQEGIMSCDISDLTMQCAPSRRKGSVEPEKLMFKFNVKVEGVHVKDLGCEECGEENSEQCEQTCKQQYMTQAMSQLIKTTNKIIEMFGFNKNTNTITPTPSQGQGQDDPASPNSDPDKPKGITTINNMTLVPKGQVHVSKANVSCGVGMESSHGVCGK